MNLPPKRSLVCQPQCARSRLLSLVSPWNLSPGRRKARGHKSFVHAAVNAQIAASGKHEHYTHRRHACPLNGSQSRRLRQEPLARSPSFAILSQLVHPRPLCQCRRIGSIVVHIGQDHQASAQVTKTPPQQRPLERRYQSCPSPLHSSTSGISPLVSGSKDETSPRPPYPLPCAHMSFPPYQTYRHFLVSFFPSSFSSLFFSFFLLLASSFGCLRSPT